MRSVDHTSTHSFRTAMAISTATLHRDYAAATELTKELGIDGARFGLIVTSEYLAKLVRSLAHHELLSADDLWQRMCMEAEDVVARAQARSDELQK